MDLDSNAVSSTSRATFPEETAPLQLHGFGGCYPKVTNASVKLTRLLDNLS